MDVMFISRLRFLALIDGLNVCKKYINQSFSSSYVIIESSYCCFDVVLTYITLIFESFYVLEDVSL